MCHGSPPSRIGKPNVPSKLSIVQLLCLWVPENLYALCKTDSSLRTIQLFGTVRLDQVAAAIAAGHRCETAKI